MKETKPFTELLRQRLAEGAGLAEWLARSGTSSQYFSWTNKLVAEALNLQKPRIVQLWVKGEVVPTLHLGALLNLFKLTPDQYIRSTRLREWARRNKNSKYIPEPLLEAWGFEIESTL